MKLHFMKDDALAYFKNNVSSNLLNYINTDNSWVKENYSYYKKSAVSPFGEFKFDVPDFKMDMSNENPAATDIENVKILYTALKGISDTQATDERFWVGLAHSELWEYMLYRNKISADNLTTEKITANFFFKFGKKRSLIMHTLSRLWWVGRMIYDENAEDPFAGLEAYKVDFAGKILTTFSNNYANNPSIVRAILKSVVILENSNIKINVSKFREILRYVNILGGIVVLDYISEYELRDKILNHYCEVHNIDIDSLIIPEDKKSNVISPRDEIAADLTEGKVDDKIIATATNELISNNDFNISFIKNNNDLSSQSSKITSVDYVEKNKENSTLMSQHFDLDTNTDISVVDYLKSKGIKVSDNRSTGGKLWVKGGNEIEGYIRVAERKFHIKFNQGKTYWWAT